MSSKVAISGRICCCSIKRSTHRLLHSRGISCSQIMRKLDPKTLRGSDMHNRLLKRAIAAGTWRNLLFSCIRGRAHVPSSRAPRHSLGLLATVTVTCPRQHSDADRAESSRRQSRASRWRHTLSCPLPALRSTAICSSPRSISVAIGKHHPPEQLMRNLRSGVDKMACRSLLGRGI